jgi:integrase/recombinase XerD
MVEDYLFFLKRKVSPNSIPSIFAGIELFLSINDKILNFRKIHKMYPQKNKKSGSRGWTTTEVQKVLRQATKPRSVALVLFLSSTGCRIGALNGLELRHIVEMPHGCKAVQLYEEEMEEYWSFLTPEASTSLDTYLQRRREDGEVLNPKSPVFRDSYRIGSAKVKPMTSGAGKTLITRLIKNAKVERLKHGNRHDAQIVHAFRKRFGTILKINQNISYSTTEALLGHKSGLDATYYKPEMRTQLFEEFRKAIPDLAVDDSERLDQQNKIKDETIKKIESDLVLGFRSGRIMNNC